MLNPVRTLTPTEIRSRSSSGRSRNGRRNERNAWLHADRAERFIAAVSIPAVAVLLLGGLGLVVAGLAG